jgi:putative colanic acid biosynthesis acetyltransferase WcaF
MNKEVDLSTYQEILFNRWSIKLKYAVWLLISSLFFLTNIPYPNPFKVFILRLFGAKIGSNCVIKPWVKIKFPWELEIGDFVWLGEEVWIDNISKVTIASHVCISQGALLLTGNHRFDKANFPLDTRPIKIEKGVWICAKATVCGGVTVENHAVLGLGCIATSDLSAYTVYSADNKVKMRTIK